MKLDYRLIGIIFSMIIILLLGLNFNKKLNNFHEIYSDTVKLIYTLKHNSLQHHNAISQVKDATSYNNDNFITSYKELQSVEEKLIKSTNIKHTYPKTYEKIHNILQTQKALFSKTEDFLQINAKIKNSLSILYKRHHLIQNSDQIYSKNLIKFLAVIIFHHDTNKAKHESITKLFEYFKQQQHINMEYKLNFIHISILYKDLPKLQSHLDNIQKKAIQSHLDKLYEFFQEQSLKRKSDLTLQLSFILAGAIFFFIVILILVKDIKAHLETLRKKDKLIATQAKHAAMGEMMDAIAHQWAQPLNIIKLKTQLLGHAKITQEYIDTFQQQMDEQIIHMTDTLREFRSFLRPNKSLQSFSAQKSIEGVLVLLQDDLKNHSINIQVESLEDFTINAIENEFKHVLINLLNNAKDAFNENKIQKRKILITIEKQSLKVLDNAGGIPESIIKNIFNANFTTKEDSQGTGIGLYMSKQILEKIHATIDVKNLQNGACFTIKFKE